MSSQRVVAGAELSAREAEIVRLIGKEITTDEIARMLGISYHTANDYIKRAYIKLGVNSRVGAAVWACKQGML